MEQYYQPLIKKKQNILESMGKLYLAARCGFCNGVRRALECVQTLLKNEPEKTIYVYNEIVHNNYVVAELKKSGVIFVRSLDEVPPGSTVVWSAHGVPPELEKQARIRGLQTVDATCPLVHKLHELAIKHCNNSDNVIFIGHSNHPEAVGVLGCGKIYPVASAS